MGSISQLSRSSTSTDAASPDDRAIFFFDIDNCLYSKSRLVHEEMAFLINKYFVNHLDLPSEEATRLHHQYYRDYGLAIEGLSRHHKIEPMDFNREVDDALPLDRLLSPDPATRALLERFDTKKVKLWLFTNAHITHGNRVVRLLAIDDLFEGITFCDYRQQELVPKPRAEMFEKAEREAGVYATATGKENEKGKEEGKGTGRKIYFVDDSYLNCKAAQERGWENTVHLVEPSVLEPEVRASKYQISRLTELLDLFPELLKEEEKTT